MLRRPHSFALPAILTLFVVFLLNADSSVNALSCPDCTDQYKAQNCPTPSCAPGLGLTTDICGCCDECYKAENEECGGVWNQGGTCTAGFTCTENADNWQYPGVCVRNSPTAA